MTSGSDAKIILAATLLCLALAGCPATDVVIRPVIPTDPLTTEEHARLGAIYEREGNAGRATQEYAAALKTDPANLVALIGMGNVLANEGKYKLAVGYYKRALAIEPDNMALANNMALALVNDGKHVKALEYADRAVELGGGGDPRVLDTRARARLGAGERAGAVADWERALELCEAVEEETLNNACDEISARRGEALEVK